MRGALCACITIAGSKMGTDRRGPTSATAALCALQGMREAVVRQELLCAASLQGNEHPLQRSLDGSCAARDAWRDTRLTWDRFEAFLKAVGERPGPNAHSCVGQLTLRCPGRLTTSNGWHPCVRDQRPLHAGTATPTISGSGTCERASRSRARVRRALHTAQDGGCAVCGESGDASPRKRQGHKTWPSIMTTQTGEVRGLLCVELQSGRSA